VNDFVFLISSSDWSLFIYRNVTDFFVLILCPDTLLNVFMRSKSVFLGLSGIRVYHLQIETI
jgi:hypothetical protein